MNRPVTSYFPWGRMLLGLFASAVTGTTLYFVLRRDEDTGSTETDYVDPNAPKLAPGATGALAPPLAMPLRKTTPNGWFGAGRPTGSPNPTRKHQGVDLKGTAGEPIYAVGNGQIVKADPGVGQTVRVLLLDDGRAVVYADLGEATVEPGQRVRTGDVVGTMRSNGFVHVAIRESRMGKFMNPAGLIPFAG